MLPQQCCNDLLTYKFWPMADQEQAGFRRGKECTDQIFFPTMHHNATEDGMECTAIY